MQWLAMVCMIMIFSGGCLSSQAISNLGTAGSLAFGRLMARQIIHELDKSGAFLENWFPGDPS